MLVKYRKEQLEFASQNLRKLMNIVGQLLITGDFSSSNQKYWSKKNNLSPALLLKFMEFSNTLLDYKIYNDPGNYYLYVLYDKKVISKKLYKRLTKLSFTKLSDFSLLTCEKFIYKLNQIHINNNDKLLILDILIENNICFINYDIVKMEKYRDILAMC